MGWKICAIDGLAKSGKTTLANQFARDLDGIYVVSMADFLLPEAKKRFSVVGKKYDIERLYIQVLEPLLSGIPVRYQKFNWSTGQLNAEYSEIPLGHKVVVEGIYSLDIKLRHAYDFSIFVHTPDHIRSERFSPLDYSRAGADPLNDPEEQLYLAAMDPKGMATVVIPGEGPLPETKNILAILGQTRLVPGHSQAA